MALLVSLFFGFVPMFLFAYIIYWLDRYEKEPKSLLGAAFFWGAVIAAGGAFIINTALGVGVYLFTGSESAADLTTGSLIAPVVEESLKGIAVLIVFFFFRNEFDSILDGMIYAGITALGFAATENAFYIYDHGFLDNGWVGLFVLVFIRVILVGWQHPFYTAFTGIGLAVARMNRSTLVRIIAPMLGFGMAIFAHALHNTLSSFLEGLSGLAIGTSLDWIGWFFMLIFVIWVIRREGALLARHLREEVEAGRMSEAQYRTAISSWAQMRARLSALTSGRYRATARFYQVCGELAHKKEQYSRLAEHEHQVTIEHLRDELSQLSSAAQA
ncbi:MAG: protease PrsW [Anaerolineae bacterium]|nr:MAG: protease PrsW [Anaerolineae bacterium]